MQVPAFGQASAKSCRAHYTLWADMPYDQVSYVFEIDRGLEGTYEALGKRLIRNINQSCLGSTLNDVRIISCTTFKSIFNLRQPTPEEVNILGPRSKDLC